MNVRDVSRHLEMMHHLTENRLAQHGICLYIYVLWRKFSGWGTKPFCSKMMGYENFFYVRGRGMKFSLIVRNYPSPW